MDFFIPILNTLVIAFFLILLIIGLMSAPWQVLLFILVLGILAYQWFIQRHHLQSVLEDLNSDVESTLLEPQGSEVVSEAPAHEGEASSQQVLHYRGATYTHASAEEEHSTASRDKDHSTVEVIGQYRGGVRKFLL